MITRPPEAAIWHDVECGSYAADLPLWRSLAQEAGGRVLEVGAGTGRVTLDLARRGHRVTAVDRDAQLLAVLRDRAEGLDVRTRVADARELALAERFALCLVPMQTIQLLGGRRGRLAFLRRAAEHLQPRGLLAAAVAEELPAFEQTDSGALPPPDLAEHAGWVFASQPLAVRHADCAIVLERRRETVAPDGTHDSRRDVVRLDRLDADQLAREAAAAGLQALPPRDIEPTADHVGSRVVVLRA